MIFTRDDTTHKVFATIPGPPGDETYECTFKMCPNPLCDCNAITIHFTLYPPSPDPVLGKRLIMDIEKRQAEIAPRADAITRQEDIDFQQSVSACMQDDDYRFLHQEYYSYKRAITEQADISSLYADFPADDIEQNGIMIGYIEILPYGDYFSLSLDEQQYLLLDHYCVKSRCSCVDAVLSCVLVNEQEQTGEEVAAYRINYKKRQWKSLDNQGTAPGTVGDLETLKQRIETAYPGFYRRLREHHQKLRALYANYLKENGLYIPQHTSRRSSEQVGRNDPCPCGSGKKFKQCCMNKA